MTAARPPQDDAAATLIACIQEGDDASLERLVPLLYDELRRMARLQRARESQPPSLHTTELVHEAYLRLVGAERATERGRAYFMGAAARAMRRVLVDAARARKADKRGGGIANVTLGDDAAAVEAYASELVDLERALSELEAESPRLARTVECRYFAGMTVEETAAALDVSPRTVKGDWTLARAWLYDALQRGESG